MKNRMRFSSRPAPVQVIGVPPDPAQGEKIYPPTYRNWIICHVCLNLLLCLLNILVAVPLPNRAEAAGYYAWGQSIVADGDFDPTNQLAGNENFPVTNFSSHPIAADKYPLGWSLVALPFMAMGQGLVVLANGLFGAHMSTDGLAALVVRLAWLGIGIYASLGLWAAHEFARRYLKASTAFWSVLLAWMGTSAMAYTWKSPGMSHAVSLASLALWFYLTSRLMDKPGGWRHLFWGMSAGLLVVTRMVNAPLLLPALFLPTAVGFSRHSVNWQGYAWGIVGFALPVGLQVLVWRIVYGMWYYNGYAAGGEGFSPHLGHTLKLLFSSQHGLFFWHPITLLAAVGFLGAAFRRSELRVLAIAMLAILSFQIVLYGSWSSWSLGDSYGARWAADDMVFWTIGIGLSYSLFRSKRWSRLWWYLCLACVTVSLVLIGGQFVHKVPLDAPLKIGNHVGF